VVGVGPDQVLRVRCGPARGSRRGASLLQALVVGVVGGVLIAFKALIH
jgi:hypothetical protein